MALPSKSSGFVFGYFYLTGSPLVKILLAHYLGHAIQRRRHFYRANRSDNVDLLYNSYPGFDFDDLEDDECLSEFRFYKNDLPFLAEVLGIPEVVEFYQRSICSGLEALCIFLKRHSYPCQYSDMIACFGKPVPVLSIIKNYMIDYIYQAPSHRILQWNDSILQSKLKENILGRCLSTGATKFFKIVLAGEKTKTTT